MNAKERRKHRRKLKSEGVKKAYALVGGKITEVEMLDNAPRKNARDPVTIEESGKIIEEPTPGIRPRNSAEEIIWKFMEC